MAPAGLLTSLNFSRCTNRTVEDCFLPRIWLTRVIQGHPAAVSRKCETISEGNLNPGKARSAFCSWLFRGLELRINGRRQYPKHRDQFSPRNTRVQPVMVRRQRGSPEEGHLALFGFLRVRMTLPKQGTGRTSAAGRSTPAA